MDIYGRKGNSHKRTVLLLEMQSEQKQRAQCLQCFAKTLKAASVKTQRKRGRGYHGVATYTTRWPVHIIRKGNGQVSITRVLCGDLRLKISRHL